MRRPRAAWLVVACVVASLVAAFDTAGWITWQRTAARLSIRPQAGATMLAGHSVLGLPYAVQASRRLAARDLAMAEREVVVAALEQVGTRQLAWFPTDPDGSKNLARAALLDGRLGEAVEQLERSLTLDPTSAYLQRLSAVVLRSMGRNEECLQRLAMAAAISPAVTGPAVDLTPEDEERVTLDGLRLRLQLYPRQRAVTLLKLARELRDRGRMQDAENLLRDESSHPEVLLELARWELAGGATASAVSRFRSVATNRAYPSSLRVDGLAGLAAALDEIGDHQSALEAAESAVELDPSSPTPFLALADMAEKRLDYAEALGHVRRAWGVDPANVQVVLRVAAVAERAGATEDAKLALRRAVELDPASAGVAARLIDFQLRHGEYMPAALQLSRSLERFPTDGRLLRLAERLRTEVSRAPPR